MNLTLKETINAINGKYNGNSNNKTIKGISIDSRTLKKGDLFIAIKGKNFDGHDFIQDALKKGAIAAIAEKNKLNIIKKRIKNKNLKSKIILTNNTTKALEKSLLFIIQNLKFL